MDVDPSRRRSRLGWPIRTEPTTTSAGTHDHAMPARHTAILYGCVVVLLLVNAGLVFYILARGAYRDEQDRQVREQIRDSWCTALDTLPEGGLLDDLREQYRCGPGRPLSELPEDIRRRYTGEPAPTPPPPPPTTPAAEPAPNAPAAPNLPPGGDSYRPEPEPVAPAPPEPTPAPEPAPTPDTGLLEPVTDTVCDLTAICIEESP